MANSVVFNPFIGKFDYVGSASSAISEVYSDPASPSANSAWVLATPTTVVGSPLGLLLSLTYSVTSYTYAFSYYTTEGLIRRAALI